MVTMKDRAFLADTEKAKLEIGPLSGREVKGIVDELFKIKPEMKLKRSSASQSESNS